MNIVVIIPTLTPLPIKRLMRLVSQLKKMETADISVYILLVVNKSSDLDEALLRSIMKPYGVMILFSRINKGFAQAVNEGVQYARTIVDVGWYFILNDDAFPSRQLFIQLCDVLHSSVYDAVSCKIMTRGNEIESVGLIYSRTGIAYPRRVDIQSKDNKIFAGTAVFISGCRIEKELSKCGYIFNPLFFAYAEDLELSLRILKDEGKIYISNASLVRHMGSQTAHRGSFFQLYHGYRNFLLIIILLWPLKDMIIGAPYIFIGQLYVLAMSMYKGYFSLYPKALWWIWKNQAALRWQRGQYAEG